MKRCDEIDWNSFNPEGFDEDEEIERLRKQGHGYRCAVRQVLGESSGCDCDCILDETIVGMMDDLSAIEKGVNMKKRHEFTEALGRRKLAIRGLSNQTGVDPKKILKHLQGDQNLDREAKAKIASVLAVPFKTIFDESPLGVLETVITGHKTLMDEMEDYREYPEPFLSLMDSLGELSGALLDRRHSGLEELVQHSQKIKAICGAMNLFLLDFCHTEGIDLADALKEQWEVVQKTIAAPLEEDEEIKEKARVDPFSW